MLSGTAPMRLDNAPDRVGGTEAVSESSNRSTERASSIAYIGLPTDSSCTRSNLGLGRESTNGDTTRRVASSESGPRKISSRRSGGIVRLSGGDERSERSVASTSTGSRSRRRKA